MGTEVILLHARRMEVMMGFHALISSTARMDWGRIRILIHFRHRLISRTRVPEGLRPIPAMATFQRHIPARRVIAIAGILSARIQTPETTHIQMIHPIRLWLQGSHVPELPQIRVLVTDPPHTRAVLWKNAVVWISPVVRQLIPVPEGLETHMLTLQRRPLGRELAVSV